MEVYAYLKVTEYSVIVLLDSPDADVKLTLTNAPANPVTTVVLVPICHKAIAALVQRDTEASTAKKKDPIVETIPVPKEPCAKMNLDTITTPVFAGQDILALIVTSRLIRARLTEILALMAQVALLFNKVDTSANAYQAGKDNSVKSILTIVSKNLVC